MLASKIFIMCPIPSLQFSYIDHKIENPMRIFAKNDYLCSQINPNRSLGFPSVVWQ